MSSLFFSSYGVAGLRRSPNLSVMYTQSKVYLHSHITTIQINIHIISSLPEVANGCTETDTDELVVLSLRSIPHVS
jgi:hypothetical protein